MGLDLDAPEAHVRNVLFGSGTKESAMVKERMHEMGPGGDCVCPKCGERRPHVKGERCQEALCPSCGARMLREGSEHHRKLEEARAKKG